MASYVTFSLEDKISLLQQLERRQSLGQVSVSQQGGGVRTEFDTKSMNPQLEIARLIQSILDDPGFTSDNRLWDALQQFRRPGMTQSVFV